MNARHLCFLVVLLALLMTLGCGGESAPKSSIISGRVTFADGLPARGATVTSRDASTVTSTNGAYVLNEVRAADQAVYAEYREGDTRYVAVNIARTFANEQDQNINLVLVPERQTASIVSDAATTVNCQPGFFTAKCTISAPVPTPTHSTRASAGRPANIDSSR